MDDRLTINLGVRSPHFVRKLHQMCYSQDGTSTVRCTNEPATAYIVPTTAAINADGTMTAAQKSALIALIAQRGWVAGSPNGNVMLSGVNSGNNATQFLAPYRAVFHFNDTLPNIGIDYKITEHGTVYLSYAEGLSAPRTDNLYTPTRGATATSILFPTAQPETTQAWDLGYRFQTDRVIFSSALWSNNFQNRIVTSFDPDTGVNIDRNVGDVKMYGFDGQLGLQLSPQWTVYVGATLEKSRLMDDIRLGNNTTVTPNTPTFIPTRGKELVETPDQMFTWRADWDPTSWFHAGIQGKYVGSRYATDINDQSAPSYHVWDLDARLNLNMFHAPHAYLQLNVTNLFDEKYLGGISSTNAFNTIDVDPSSNVLLRSGASPTFTVGAPRTTLLTLHTEF
jgi:iron complex outermembrane receptor protein